MNNVCGKCSARLQKFVVCQGCQMTAYCNKNCLQKHQSAHKSWCENQNKKLVKAYCEASNIIVKEFPRSKMSTFAALNWEHCGYGAGDRCMVARIMWKIAYFRICLFVVDPLGSPCFTSFYLEGDSSRFFSPGDIQPGNLLLFNRAQKHRFLDGQVGLRIENPQDVRIIRV